MSSRGVYDFDGDSAKSGRKNNGAWSFSGRLLQGNPDLAVTAQAVFDEPGPYTVSFDVNINPTAGINPQPIDNPLSSPLIIQGNVHWSVAGNETQRRVTISPGTTMTGVAEGVRVSVRDRSLNTGVTKIDYDVTILICKGNRPDSDKRVLLDGDIIPIAANSSFITGKIPYPQGVKGVLCTVVNAAGGVIPTNSIILSLQANGNTNTRFQCDPRDYEVIAVPGSCTSYSIQNLNAFAITAYTQWVIDA